MCDCCDPTHDSPDPVVVRLEREVERLKGELQKHLSLRESLDELYSIANLTKEVGTLRGLLREAVMRCDSTSSIRRYDVLRLDDNWFKRVTAALEGKP